MVFRAGMFKRFALISTSTRYCWPGFMPQSYHAVRCFRNRQRFGGAVVLGGILMVFWEMGLEATKARKMPWPVSSLEQNFRYQRITSAWACSPGQPPDAVCRPSARLLVRRGFHDSLSVFPKPKRYGVYLANRRARAALTSLECGACRDWSR